VHIDGPMTPADLAMALDKIAKIVGALSSEA